MLTPADLPPPLRLMAAPRVRTLDNRRYTVTTRANRGTFRLQLFTAPGTRPAAVAIQIPMERDAGASLTNGAERYAAAVWRDHFPHDDEPPVWIARMFLPGRINQSFTQFTVVEKYTLRFPAWAPLSDDEVCALVGAEVALTRR